MTPIERAARAMAQIDGMDPDGPAGDPSRPIWRMYVSRVEAVAVALREPSPAMTTAGADRLDLDSDGGLIGGSREAADNAYAAMIDALLEEDA